MINADEPTNFELYAVGPESANISSWAVYFGDGGYEVITTPPALIATPDSVWYVQHTYAEAGPYMVAVYATDSGGSNSVDADFTVAAADRAGRPRPTVGGAATTARDRGVNVKTIGSVAVSAG